MCAAEVMKVRIKTKERRRGENSGLTSKTGVCAQVRACVRFSETHEKRECVLCVCNCVFYVYKSI